MSTDKKTLELLSRVKGGDDLAFEALAEKYRKVIESASLSAYYSLERSGTVLRADALEDLKQEARLALYRAALKYDECGDGKKVTFGLFAKICVRNALISELRRSAAEKRRADRLVKQGEEALAASDSASNELLTRLCFEQLLRERGHLLSRYEKKVLLAYVDGKSYSDIAAEAGKTPKSVYNAIYRIKTKLQPSTDEEK